MVSSFLFIFAGMEKIYNYYQDIVTAYTRRADNLKKKIQMCIRDRYQRATYLIGLNLEIPAPERRCSSRTFRYGYLVTT